MSSLRSRTTRATPGSRTEIASYKRRKKRRSSQETSSNQLLPKVCLALLFLVVCTLLGYREYNRVHPNLAPNTVRKTTVLSPDEDAALEFHSDHTRYHVIFSTDCTPYQHWQSYLMFYSAYKVRQPGHVTRIASGCTEEEAVAIKEWHETHISRMSSRFHLHLTPHFSGVKSDTGETVGDYKFFNKPFGLKHWLEHADSRYFSLAQQDDIVILIDPDMVLMRPLVGDFSDSRETLISPNRKGDILGTRVDHGTPFAQTYGLGTQWQKFNLDNIAGTDSPAKLVTKEEGFLHFPVGPPYIATVRDMHQIAEKWTEFVPRVHAEYPHLLAEMYAFCIAAAHLGLKHQLIDSLMVSNTGSHVAEGWDLVDKIPASEVCEFAAHPDHDHYALPSLIHLCQRYALGDEWFFGKRKVPHDIFACEKPLLKEPPSNVALLFDFKRPPNQKEEKAISKKQAAREAFMICYLTTMMNEASAFYKQNACPAGTANLDKTLKLAELFDQKH